MSKNNSPDKKRKREEDPEEEFVEDKTQKRQKLDQGQAKIVEKQPVTNKKVVNDEDSEDFNSDGSDGDSFDDDFDNEED